MAISMGTGSSPSERLTAKANAYKSLASDLRAQGYRDQAEQAFGRSAEFYESANRARQWEHNRFDRTK